MQNHPVFSTFSAALARKGHEYAYIYLFQKAYLTFSLFLNRSTYIQAERQNILTIDHMKGLSSILLDHQGWEKSYLQNYIKTFNISPIIACRAIVQSKSFYRRGSEVEAERYLDSIIEEKNHISQRTNNGHKFIIWEELAFMLNKLQKCHKRLESSLVRNNYNPKAFKASIKAYFYFNFSWAYLKLLSFEQSSVHSFFNRELQFSENDINAMEGMLLSSYRLRKYQRTLEEFRMMQRTIPVVSRWTLPIAAVCYAKLNNHKQALSILAKVNQQHLSYDEKIFYFGVLYLVGQEKQAIMRESMLPINLNRYLLNLQREIVAMLCEQRLGNTSKASEILESIKKYQIGFIPNQRLYLVYHQILFLLKYHYSRNRLREGRCYLLKLQNTIALIRQKDIKIEQRLLQQLNQHHDIDIQMIQQRLLQNSESIIVLPPHQQREVLLCLHLVGIFRFSSLLVIFTNLMRNLPSQCLYITYLLHYPPCLLLLHILTASSSAD